MNGENYKINFDLRVAEGDFPTDKDAENSALNGCKLSINNYFEKSSPGVDKRGATTNGNIIQLNPSKGGVRSLAHEIGHTLGVGEWTYGLMSQGSDETSITNRNIMQILGNAGIGEMPKSTHFYNNPLISGTTWSNVGKGWSFTIMKNGK